MISIEQLQINLNWSESRAIYWASLKRNSKDRSFSTYCSLCLVCQHKYGKWFRIQSHKNIHTHQHTSIPQKKLKAFESDAIRTGYYQSIRDIQRGCITNTHHRLCIFLFIICYFRFKFQTEITNLKNCFVRIVENICIDIYQLNGC